MLTLITGGARSGKSTFAQSLCATDARVVYIATASADDDEMRQRILLHRESRPGFWLTIEEPVAVPAAVAKHSASVDFVVVDCLTVWLSNLLYEWRVYEMAAVQQKTMQQADELITASRTGKVIAVTNEVGSGIVPESPLARRFRDLQGFMNQRIARAADNVYLVVSGIPLPVKTGANSCD
jgi:adenosylcobinamide kinase/adenosylcobinamide-phosphate guanylyltransferase